MDYQKIYNQLIERAKFRNINGYTEKHHIVPVSMGGSNKKSNIVELTGREHLVAHLLLWKIHKNTSMSAAIWFMAHSRGIRINSRIYENLKIEFSNKISIQLTGKIVSEETKIKMSKSFTGRIFTEEHRANIGKSSKGRKNPMKGKSFNLSEAEIKRRSDLRKGKNLGNPGFIGTHSEESKQKMSEKKKNHPPTNYKKVSVDGIEYNSATEAAKILGITYNCMIRRIREEKYISYFYL